MLCAAGWSLSCAVATTRGAFKCRSGPSRPPPSPEVKCTPTGAQQFFFTDTMNTWDPFENVSRRLFKAPRSQEGGPTCQDLVKK